MAPKPPNDDDGLPSDSDSDDAPLLGEGEKKVPASDAPMSPRDKMKNKSKDTPLTPRSAAKALEDQASAALEDPAAAAAAAKAALEAADPAAAKALAAAEAAAQAIKDDPKAAAMAAMEAAKNIKPPTAEELAASREAYEKELAAGREMAKKLWEEMMNDRPPSCYPLADLSKRTERYIDLLISQIPEGKIPPNVQEQIKPNLTLAIKILAASQGWVSFVVRWVGRIYNMLPFNVAQMIFGAALCYFGGTFTTTIAAAEAFRTMGYERASADVKALMVELEPLWVANDADDEVDDDGDGIADVDELTPPELLQRKIFIIVTTVKNPDRIQSAIGSIYAALLAVLATLKLEFAATTAMAMGVADMIKKPLIRLGKPKLELVLPPASHQWIEPTIDSTTRIVAISLAWYLQVIISAFYSALRGGKLFASGLFNILVEKAKVGIVLCPGMVGVDYDPDDSILDDVIGWIIAAQGFMFQFNTGFSLPFPFSLILFPLSFFEWYLRFQIAGGSTASDGGRRMEDQWCAPVGWNASATCSPVNGMCWCTLMGAAAEHGLQCSSTAAYRSTWIP